MSYQIGDLENLSSSVLYGYGEGGNTGYGNGYVENPEIERTLRDYAFKINNLENLEELEISWTNLMVGTRKIRVTRQGRNVIVDEDQRAFGSGGTRIKKSWPISGHPLP